MRGPLSRVHTVSGAPVLLSCGQRQLLRPLLRRVVTTSDNTMATALFLRGYHLVIAQPILVLATLHSPRVCYVHAARSALAPLRLRGKLWTVTIQLITGRGRPRDWLSPASRDISSNRFVHFVLYHQPSSRVSRPLARTINLGIFFLVSITDDCSTD